MLTASEKNILAKFLNGKKVESLTVVDIWKLMDQVWDEIGCGYSNKPENLHRIDRFYAHPIWGLNGLFVEIDKESVANRKLIDKWIRENGKKFKIKSILDFGGGFGTLARLIATSNPTINVDIFEPHPSESALKLIRNMKNIKYITKIDKKYDCIVCTDVLEHLPDPLKTLENMKVQIKREGILIVGSCFYPVIKCHLPSNFYLRYFFNFFSGLYRYFLIKAIPGGYIYIYKNTKAKANLLLISVCKYLAKILYPLLNFLQSVK